MHIILVCSLIKRSKCQRS